MGKGESDGAEVCLYRCIIIFVLGLVGLGIAQSVIGEIYRHDCSLERMIPNYLIVSAWSPILYGGFAKYEEDSGSICGFTGFSFNIVWLICGSIWVYPTYAKVHKDTYIPCTHVNGTYTPAGCTIGTCNDTLLTFSFAIVTIHWIFMVFWMSVVGFIIVKLWRSRCY